jgi:molybdopterin molybdotransferase
MQTLRTNISVEEAIATYARIQPVAPKRIPIFEANGLRVAEDIIVKRPVPMVDTAAHDGWAVTAASTAGATRRKPMLLAGPAIQVDAGVAVPPGTDAILPLEHGIKLANSEVASGSVLVPAGTRVTFAAATACAHCGILDALVRRPVVDIIFNSVGFTRPRDNWCSVIASAIRSSGCEIGAIQFTAGDASTLAEAMLGSSADVITVVGGTGVGPGDTTMQALAMAGDVIFHGVRLSPGPTVGFGMVGSKPVFCSPGGIAEMIAVNIVLSWPFARQAFGRPPLSPPFGRAKLIESLPASPKRSRLVFARYSQGTVAPFDSDSLSPAVLAQANATIFIPEGARHRRKGEQVRFLRLGTTM